MSSPARWVLFCDAQNDAEMVQHLVDQLIRLHGAEWIGGLLDSQSEQVRSWWKDPGSGTGRRWFDLHRCYADAAALGVTVHQGHFGGDSQRPGALMIDTAFRIVRKLHQQAKHLDRPTGVVVLWDADGQADERREGIAQAVEHGLLPPSGVGYVVALADPEREAWVAAGFDPKDDDERARLEACRRELGFHPNEHPERLTARRANDKADSKRTLDALGVSDERERECLRIADADRRALLLRRGAACGLADWIRDVETKLLPQVDPSIPSRLRSDAP